MVFVIPASPVEATTVTPAAMAAASAAAITSWAVDGSGLPPKDWLRTLTWSVVDGILDRLQEAGRARDAGRLAEDLEADQADAGSLALDADLAGAVEHAGAEVRHVVDLVALRADRAGVEEGLAAGGRRVQPVTGEVLVVAEDAVTVADEVRVVDVDALGHERHLDAGAVVAERARGLGSGNVGIGVGDPQGFWAELHRVRVGRAYPGGRGGLRRGGRGSVRGGGGLVDHGVGNDLGDIAVGGQGVGLGLADLGRYRVDEGVRGVDRATGLADPAGQGGDGAVGGAGLQSLRTTSWRWRWSPGSSVGR